MLTAKTILDRIMAAYNSKYKIMEYLLILPKTLFSRS